VSLVYVPLGIFLFVKLSTALWLAISLLVFFVGLSALSLIFSIRRIPAWHRARRVAREYLAEHGGRMPPELRTWN
jgi:hypothetical protein